VRFPALSAAAALLLTAAPASATPKAPPAQQWFLDAQHFDSARVWSLSTGKGVTVAVVDSGVDSHHPDLTGQVKPSADMTGEGTDGRTDLSGNAHGTSVAAIIAGTGHGPDRITGLAPDATILPVRISDGLASDPAVLAQGIDYATTHGAQVINVSICALVLNPQVRTAVEAAIRHDVVVVAAAGNDGLAGNQPQYPAALPGVIAVAASDAQGARWPKSESGPYLGLTAPGVDIYSAGPQGSHIQATGTSFAAPQVAATAALLRSRYPKETAGQIIERLTTTAHGTGQGRNPQWGYGIIDPYQALTARPAAAGTANPLLEQMPSATPGRPAPSASVAWVTSGIGAAVGVGLAVFIIRRRGSRSRR
jgi:type VII secretion-associated serine protease mycosin